MTDAPVTVANENQRMTFSPNLSETAPPTRRRRIIAMPGAATMKPWTERSKPRFIA